MSNLKLRADIFRERGYAKVNPEFGAGYNSFTHTYRPSVHKINTVTRYSVDGWEFISEDNGQFYRLSISIPISQKEYEKTKVLNALGK